MNASHFARPFFVWAIAICLCWPATAVAQVSTPPALPQAPLTSSPVIENESELARGMTIIGIQVAGNRRVSEQDIEAYLKLGRGNAFTPEGLATDVHELWTSGLFDDIEVDLERQDDGVVLRFIVRERPNISKVEFEGNSEIETEDLLDALEVKDGTILSRPALQRATQKIRDLYAEQGYFLAEAESAVTPQKNNEVLVVFKITEHNQVSVKRVTFIGNQHLKDNELREVMFTGNAGFMAFGSGGPYRQDAFERDIAVISALYYDRGFLTVQVHTPRVMLTPDRNGIEISITIDEGPRYKIRKLRIYERGPDGKEVEPIGGRRRLRARVRAKSGDYFNRAQLVDDLGSVRTLYRDEGYANVEANPDTHLDEATHEVDVTVPIVRGPVVYFERIEMLGNTKTRDKVIRREMKIQEGDKFSETLLERSRRLITALGYFERVDISTQSGSAPNKVQVNVEVSERPTGTFQVGAGFSSIESFIATAQVQQANLFGHGQSLSLNASLSGIRQSVNIRLFDRYFLDTPFRFSIDLFDQVQNFGAYTQAKRGGALTFGYPIIQPELSVSIRYKLERLDISAATSQASFLSATNTPALFTELPLANLMNDGLTSSLTPAVTYDSRDNRLFPTGGIYLRGQSELAVAPFGSENEFWKHSITGRYYYGLGHGFVLKLNTEFGLVTSPSQDGVPIFARYFLGGILNMRGFIFRSLGPRMPLCNATDPNCSPIPNGANIGGNMQYYQNLELEFPLLDKVGIRGVLFTDAGNAWNLEQNYCDTGRNGIPYDEVSPCFEFPYDFSNLRTSYGFGVRWFSPLGPLRFEWGFPFDPLPYEQDSRFEFTIGNFF
ncbi:MAG: outer membrane protein assembly factor BamA [Polyangiaceae bacterium]|nr:outer membrane protein assembly factor BamA [Polyangiaceae bacterium]